MKKVFLLITLFLVLSVTDVLAGNKCQACPRDSKGRIKRSSAERQKFLKSKGLTHTPKGYVIDHIVPLYRGGEDKAENMQLITIEQDRIKDRP